MSANVNKAILVGRLGAAPNIQTKDGSVFGSISVGTNRTYKGKDGNLVEEPTWHNVSVFGKAAEFAGEYLDKGSAVYVEGRLRTRKYTAKDGSEKYVTEIVASNLQGLGSKNAK